MFELAFILVFKRNIFLNRICLEKLLQGIFHVPFLMFKPTFSFGEGYVEKEEGGLLFRVQSPIVLNFPNKYRVRG